MMRSKMNSLPSYGQELEALTDNGVPHPSRWQVWGGEWRPVAVEEEEEGETQKKQKREIGVVLHAFLFLCFPSIYLTIWFGWDQVGYIGNENGVFLQCS